MVDRCYATSGLLDALLALSADREPESVSLLLVVSPAAAFEPRTAAGDGDVADLHPETPVFTDFYLPSERRSVDAVFGVDVSVPHGQAQGRFVSHPLGELDVSTTDDLHEVVIVAVPPWTRDDVAAFDRSGRRIDLTVVEDAPPAPPFEE